MKKLSLLLYLCYSTVYAQSGYWQQHVHYAIDIDMDVVSNRFTGTEVLRYTNNSPDTLKKIFYHLYWNAFQPGSMMDVHTREMMKQPTSLKLFNDQVRDRIERLRPDEVGYQHIRSLTMDGRQQAYKVDETILEVTPDRPIPPHTTVILRMAFETQVPLLIRRGGRDNPETGIRYSMSQWYPKICEYDADGWHPTPYVEREFYGVWGDFDVRIRIDHQYVLGGTGYRQDDGRDEGEKATWHFIADSVHDFMWVADTAYRLVIRQVPGGPMIHVLYVNHQRKPSVDTSWSELASAVAWAWPLAEQHFGRYPYGLFTVAMGGDGGMEYPMSCLLASPNTSQAFHEMLHSWYYGLMANNESTEAWMDEGFTSYAQDIIWDRYLNWFVDTHPQAVRGRQIRDYFQTQLPLVHAEQYQNYFKLQHSGLEEPLTTHADHFVNRVAYDIGDYGKGDVFLEQLGYIVGAPVRDSILLEYYHQWRFKHPHPGDLFHVAETVSGQKLDWYREYWIGSTKSIDYGIDSVWEEGGQTRVRLKNKGSMPMPLDIEVRFKDGTAEMDYIPQYWQFGSKPAEGKLKWVPCQPWKWTSSVYILTIARPLQTFRSVEIDPSQRMADVDRADNVLKLP